jgi:hypothetical protein
MFGLVLGREIIKVCLDAARDSFEVVGVDSEGTPYW